MFSQDVNKYLQSFLSPEKLFELKSAHFFTKLFSRRINFAYRENYKVHFIVVFLINKKNIFKYYFNTNISKKLTE